LFSDETDLMRKITCDAMLLRIVWRERGKSARCFVCLWMSTECNDPFLCCILGWLTGWLVVWARTTRQLTI